MTEVASKFDSPQGRHKCVCCTSRSDIVTCYPCGHQSICIDCFDIVFNNSDKCPELLCNSSVHTLRMPEKQPYKEVSIPILDQNEEIQCSICLDACAPTLLFPCLHNVVCFKCIYTMRPKKCPLCREDIKAVKESGRELRNMNVISQEIDLREAVDFEQTVQVVFFAETPPHDLLQIQETSVQNSRFSPNWESAKKGMRLTWYSSFMHISVQVLIDKKPDIVIIAQTDSSVHDLEEFAKAHHTIREIVEDGPATMQPHTLARLIVNDRALHFYDHISWEIVHESEREVHTIYECDAVKTFEIKQSTDFRQQFFETVWKSAQHMRLGHII